MNIAYSTDENYVRHVFVSLNSLLDSNREEALIDVYIVDNEILPTSRKLLNKLVDEYNDEQHIRHINYIDFKKYEHYIKDAMPWGSLSTYGRLFLVELTNIDKVLYIDCDTVVCSSLGDIFSSDMSGFAIAGVQDNAGPISRIGVGLSYEDRYINAGVVLLNLDFWRENASFQKCLNFIKKYKGQVPCADQGTLNGVFKGKIKILPPKYNVMTPMFDFSADKLARFFEIGNYYSNAELEEAIANPIIIHYTGGFHIRPWFVNANHPRMDIYRKYMDKSPWKNQYLPEVSLGKRTEMMYKAYKKLPFHLFLLLHRIIRGLKRLTSHEE